MKSDWEVPYLDREFYTKRDRQRYGRMADAFEQMIELHAMGVVTEDLVDDLAQRMRRVVALLRADTVTTRLGGASSSRLRHYIVELTELMVDAIDAAVEHQASALLHDKVLPVTLDELRDRQVAKAEGHGEVADW